VLAVLGSNAMGASMFIAAFVAGLAVQVIRGRRPTAARSWHEWDRSPLSVFFMFGTLWQGDGASSTPRSDLCAPV
jgi:hypothetical protein